MFFFLNDFRVLSTYYFNNDTVYAMLLHILTKILKISVQQNKSNIINLVNYTNGTHVI